MAIWDYGSGKTYATPQAAFDACQLANGGAAPETFTETEYIRGYGDAVYNGSGAGEPVLRLYTEEMGGVLPTLRFPLVLDRDGLSLIDFVDDQDAGALVGSSSIGTVSTSNVLIDGPNLHSTATATGKALIVNPIPYNLVQNWKIKNSDLYASLNSLDVSLLIGLHLANVRLPGQNSGGAIWSNIDSVIPFYGKLTMLNCMIRALGPCLRIGVQHLALAAYHCAFWSEDDVLYLRDDGSSYWHSLTLLNSILQTIGDGKNILNCIPGPDLFPGLLNANCYHFPGAASALSNLAGGDTLANWQTLFGQDGESLNLDPQMTDAQGGDFTLQQNSPCRMRGRTATAAGIEGNERALSVDIGAYQPSLAANWSLKSEGGSIVANLQGRLPINLP